MKQISKQRRKMLAVAQRAVIAVMIKAIFGSSSNRMHGGFTQIMMPTAIVAIRGQVMFGSMAGLPTAAGGPALVEDRERQVGVGTTRIVHGLVGQEISQPGKTIRGARHLRMRAARSIGPPSSQEHSLLRPGFNG